MKKTVFSLLLMALMCLTMTAADVQGQPLLKTHVETGDVQGVLEGSLAVYKAIPYAAPPVGGCPRVRQVRTAAPTTYA